jgi:exopolysaccharide biosynthesis predicted pyruvyltransferase EpsI
MTNLYNFIDVDFFIEKYKNIKNIIYVPNPGNAGDCIIAYSTIKIFDKFNIKYLIGNYLNVYKNKTIFYGGGGNLIGIYNNCKTFLINNMDLSLNNQIIILPHTIKSEDLLLSNMNNNIKIICREPISYDYVKQHFKHSNNIYLSHDMAFYLDINKDIDISIDISINNNENILNCFRNDKEKTSIDIPKDNKDLPLLLNTINSTKDFIIIQKISKNFIKEIAKYKIINTNRLHVAIIASLLNKKVNFYSNNYYKNESVYRHSINKKFKLTNFYKLSFNNKYKLTRFY